MAEKRLGVEEWVERLKTEEMPVFGKTAQEIAKLCSQSAVPTSVLANVILRDASMTARVLRLGNSAFYPKTSPITTVSRAITLLGFDVVAKACISVAFVDSLLTGKPREHLVRDMARSFYAAVLARTMALSRKDESPEEVFVAALLYRLGEMAFWCFGGRLAEKLELVLEEPHVNRARAEQMLLGFRLGSLTEALAKEWMLGDVLIAALSVELDENSRSLGVVLAHQYAEGVEDPDRAEDQRKLLTRMARYASFDPELFREIVHENSNLAAELALSFGADVAIPVIPGQTGGSPPRLDVPPPSPSSSRITALPDIPIPDANLQLKILRELVMVAETQPELDVVLQLALEGMYRGIEFS